MQYNTICKQQNIHIDKTKAQRLGLPALRGDYFSQSNAIELTIACNKRDNHFYEKEKYAVDVDAFDTLMS